MNAPTRSLRVAEQNQRSWSRVLGQFTSGPGQLAALAILSGFLVWYVGLFGHALIDDAFITLTYVKTLTSTGTWGFYPSHLANTATSPLNVLLLSLISLLAGSITGSPVWLAAACFITMAVALDRTSLRLFGRRWLGWMATAAFVFNPWLLSTLGLESIFLSTLLVVCLYLTTVGKWHWLAFCLGLLSITRADGLLFTVVFLLHLPKSQIRFRFIAILLGTLAPWYLFSWIHLGSLVPDSLIIRVTQTSWHGAAFFSGLQVYVRRYPAETLLSFAYLALLPTLAIRQVRNQRMMPLVLTLGVSHFLAYSLLRVPPYHWYYAPECAATILFGMLALGALVRGEPAPRLRPILTAVIVIMMALPLAGMSWLLARDHFNVAQMPIHTNLATEAEYRRIGLQLSRRIDAQSVLVKGEIGTLGYYCSCELLDPFSDRRWLTAGVHEAASAGGISAALYRVNFLFLRPDPGFAPYAYILTVRSDPQATRYPYVEAWQASTSWSPMSWIVLAEVPISAQPHRQADTAGHAGAPDSLPTQY